MRPLAQSLSAFIMKLSVKTLLALLLLIFTSSSHFLLHCTTSNYQKCQFRFTRKEDKAVETIKVIFNSFISKLKGKRSTFYSVLHSSCHASCFKIQDSKTLLIPEGKCFLWSLRPWATGAPWWHFKRRSFSTFRCGSSLRHAQLNHIQHRKRCFLMFSVI